jgi:hypothetical protein
MTAETWGTKLAFLNWQYILKLWYTRNKELHGTTKEEQGHKRHQDLVNKLRYIQQQHQDMPLIQRRLIAAHEERIKAMQLNSLASYIRGERVTSKSALQT